MIKILPNKEELTSKKEETKEYCDYIKKMKKFNPRLAEENVRRNVKIPTIEKEQINRYIN